ncbi:trypsin-like peptidase domain-containing protein [uncultured Roseobacter sp.]|uniref:trypsin-like serine peptidase n=1 Tax=uncultured Roseobacter sp. TaxID=114847 RepID=UPI00263446DF|nr:trypsin-like peptidase domain-containing protein [uncultured Roseobacter sp.]
MTCRRNRVKALALVLVAAVFTAPLLAEPFPVLPPEERAKWTAVGTVNRAGFRSISSCTGTLIAPDLVLTAAHCVDGQRHFVAGWERGKFVAHRISAEALSHPAYAVAPEGRRPRFDVALLRLSEPIPAEVITPLPLSDDPALRDTSMTLLGYHRKRPHLLSGRSDCQRWSGDIDIITIDCEVISGNSGGPVLAQTDAGWVIIGVVAQRIGGYEPRALAVPVGDWLLEEWRQGLARARNAAPDG